MSAATVTTSSAQKSEVDVLIVGAGPSGLMMALWMARLGIKTRVVDKRTDKVFSGQADGFQVRTLEILDSFGIGEKVWKEANHMLEVSFWNPDRNGRIRRNARAPDTLPGLSRFSECVLHQGRMEAFFLDAIRGSESPAHPAVQIDRCTLPTSLRVDEHLAEDDDAYPVEVTLRRLSEHEATPTQRLGNLSDGMHRSNMAEDDTGAVTERSAGRVEETVRAKYLVGCDGAHSWVRKTLGAGYEMVGETTDAIWGVLDIIPITDFPDIRNRCMVHSADAGTVMIIPRENRLVRLYIQLKEVSTGTGRVDRSTITPDLIFKTAQKILSPYSIKYHFIDWWTAYQIGQRSGNRFSKFDRIFLAGDAVHTHSPKAGQGMNTSMQDTYNLGWKLGLVCKQVLRRSVLATYELERRQIAKQLIEFDQRFSKLFTGRPAKDILDETGVSMKVFQEAFRMSQMFTTGIGICYQPSMLVSRADDNGRTVDSYELLATGCKPGTRFASCKVLGQADPRPWELHHHMPSDGRFRVIVFGGDVSRPAQLALVNGLGGWLSTVLLPRCPRVAPSPGSSPQGGWFETAHDTPIVDVLLVHSAPREAIELLTDLHDVYHPFDEKLGWDYDKAFADGPSYHEGHGRAYEAYGIDADGGGAAVVVRPDGYIGLVTSLDDDGRHEMGRWFDAVLRTSA